MRWHDPPLDSLDSEVRILFRSRHVYLLLTGLINLTLGSYLSFRPAGPARLAQIAGSGLLLASPAVVFLAFCVEPEGPGIASPLTPLAIAMTLAGVILHFLASGPWRE